MKSIIVVNAIVNHHRHHHHFSKERHHHHHIHHQPTSPLPSCPQKAGDCDRQSSVKETVKYFILIREAILRQLCIFFNIVQTGFDPPSPLV